MPLFNVLAWLLTVGFCLCLSGSCYLMFGQVRISFLTIAVGAIMLWLGYWLYRRARGILRRMHDQLAARTAVSEPKP